MDVAEADLATQGPFAHIYPMGPAAHEIELSVQRGTDAGCLRVQVLSWVATAATVSTDPGQIGHLTLYHRTAL
jgi:hypothetical protein